MEGNGRLCGQDGLGVGDGDGVQSDYLARLYGLCLVQWEEAVWLGQALTWRTMVAVLSISSVRYPIKATIFGSICSTKSWLQGR